MSHLAIQPHSTAQTIIKPASVWELALAGSPGIAKTQEAIRAIHDQGIAANSKRALTSDLKYFWAWVKITYQIEIKSYPVPVEVVKRFIADHVQGLDYLTDYALRQAGIKAKPGLLSLSTIERRISSLSTAHEACQCGGENNPCRAFSVRKLLESSAKVRVRNGETITKKTALTLDLLQQLLDTCQGGSLADARDRAVLSFGFATGGRRREEIAGANIEDLDTVQEGFIFRLARSKTDQKGDGASLPVFGLAGEYLLEWLAAANIRQGALFRRIDRHGNILGRLSPAAVAGIVKARCQAAGLSPDQFAGHSLRSGYITSGGKAGIALTDLMPFSTHKTMQIAAGYYQAGTMATNPAAWLMDKIGGKRNG